MRQIAILDAPTNLGLRPPTPTSVPGCAKAPGALRDQRLVDRLRARCIELGGALVVLDAPPEVKAAVDTWGPVPALDLMERVKHRFDPERRLAPGRFVGGI